MNKISSVIYFSSNEWNSYWIIQQPVANELSKIVPVLYVERNVSLFTILRYPTMWRKLFMWMRGIRKVKENLYVYSPIPLFHLGHRFPMILFADFYLKALAVKLITRMKPEFSKPTLFFDSPYYQKALTLFPESTSVYHIGDELSAFSTSHPEKMEAIENNFLPKVNVVFCAATKLVESKRQWNPNIHLIWNAIDHEIFRKENVRVIEEMTSIRKPIIGFCGVVSSWFDGELFEAVVDLLPEFSFVIIGKFIHEQPPFVKKKNVYFLGSKPRNEMPSVLSMFDVGIIPFKKNRLVENILPLKYFEYLAVGKPIVATSFSPDLEKVRQYVTLADAPHEFADAIRSAVHTDSEEKIRNRKKTAAACTWENRVQEMLTILQS
ncbi:MAG: glycosyltransferase [Bacteroidota bacterium]